MPLIAVLLTALLHFFGTGLEPLPLLTWLIPLPMLLVAPRMRAWTAGVAAAVAWTAGGMNMWTYQRDLLEMPIPLSVASIVVPALVAAAVTLVFRLLVLRGRPVLAALAAPGLWVGAEYLVSITTPNGAFWSLAYTQTDVLPVAQLAALTGNWGISFLLICVPCALATRRVLAPAIALTLVVASLGYGLARLSVAPGTASRTVALLAAGQQGDWAPVDTERGRTKLKETLDRLRALPTGTEMAVLAEGAFITKNADLPTITTPLRTLAKDRSMTIVAGVIVTDTNRNTAVYFPPTGGAPQTYQKQHLIPGVEPYEPGKGILTVAELGVTICKDLDFPALARDYRRGGATLMLAPAWDLDADGWLHSRMAIMRGIENGFSLARSGANGRLTLTDPYGRMTTETTTSDHNLTIATATVTTEGVNTVATQWGDWFAWLCLAGAGIAVCARRRPPLIV
ncbi:nitrilase-related carbon-nitrogen hydrolase [Nonomuraea sp. NPDC050556]|uniref:nitrilase-related carbon-nitrogen hydrolase n=1 Tax=Nonomuraea sp. NPDC050556 TaxID=3364369 RepID=UPI00378FEEFA